MKNLGILLSLLGIVGIIISITMDVSADGGYRASMRGQLSSIANLDLLFQRSTIFTGSAIAFVGGMIVACLGQIHETLTDYTKLRNRHLANEHNNEPKTEQGQQPSSQTSTSVDAKKAEEHTDIFENADGSFSVYGKTFWNRLDAEEFSELCRRQGARDS